MRFLVSARNGKTVNNLACFVHIRARRPAQLWVEQWTPNHSNGARSCSRKQSGKLGAYARVQFAALTVPRGVYVPVWGTWKARKTRTEMECGLVAAKRATRLKYHGRSKMVLHKPKGQSSHLFAFSLAHEPGGQGGCGFSHGWPCVGPPASVWDQDLFVQKILQMKWQRTSTAAYPEKPHQAAYSSAA